jgi:transposase
MSKTEEDVPKIEEKSKEELDEIIRVIGASSLPQPIKDFIIKCIEMALWFPPMLQKKTISLHRLRTMLFGKGHTFKKKSKVQVDEAENKAPKENSGLLTTTETIEHIVNVPTVETGTTKTKEKKPGHGRLSHTAYEPNTETTLKIVGFKRGDFCPQRCGGRLYDYNPKKPRVLIRIKGRNFADIHKYTVERLRCNLCHYLIQADVPNEVGDAKYDASFKSWLALQKYCVAVPFYRQETFQMMLNFPMPDATQWDLVEQVAGCCYGIFNVLKMCAANGKRIHNDDTSLRIQQIIRELKNNPDAERRGMFTSGFIAEYEGHRIALFLNGTQHAGENLGDILKKRDKEKPPIIQMCDALSCNIAKGVETIIANCLSHGFRKFQELVDYFPTPCITIMKLLSQVYKEDEKTKGMSDDERLQHHKQHSQPVMEMLHTYLQALFDERLVEPNSELGKAIHYMQKHWHKLTRFLSVSGAPLCNNVLERALKIAIRNRKAAFFYRTVYSANIGGMLTSLIYTCYLANENPHLYLTTLQGHSADVQKNPHEWLPWNYKDTLKALNGRPSLAEARAANEEAPGPVRVALAAK